MNGDSPYIATPQRAASKCDSGSRSAAALFAACRVRWLYCSVAVWNRSSCARANATSLSAVARCVISPDDLGRRRRQLGEAVAAHARVELQVHAHALRYLVVDNHELEPGIAGQRDLTVRAGGAHDDDPLGAVLVA